MVVSEYLENGALIRHYSDKGIPMIQTETGIEYEEAVDVVPCRYSYEEAPERKSAE